jgi:hypothetical protein
MSDLSFIEKHKLEKLLGMGSGYVLGFSNRTFSDFVVDSTGRNIYDAKYDKDSGSKANRLRAFWAVEPNHIVGKLLLDLLEFSKTLGIDEANQSLFEDCSRIAQRLQLGAPVQELAEIVPNAEGREFEVLAKSVRDAIERNEPETGLDRLHTFAVKYLRVLCSKRGISTDRDKPLHSLLGEYVRRLKQERLIESEMTERILKSSISTLDAFCGVRNEQSLAHDNPVLNYDESLLIFNHVASAIKFIRTVEERADRLSQTTPETEVDPGYDDVPF